MAMDKIIELIELKPKEEVLKIERQSLLPLTPKILFFAVWFITPFFFLFALFRLGTWGVGLFFLLIFSAFFYGLAVYKKWSRTVFIITDRRVIDIDQKGLFDRQISHIPFNDIDEVSYRIRGVIPTMLRYGAVRMQVSGNAADIMFQHVRNPGHVHDLLNDLRKVILDEDEDKKEEKLKDLAKDLSVEELEEIVHAIREKEQDEAAEEVFGRRILD